MRIAVVGAGPSGLSQLHAFECARKTGHTIPDIVCFEKQADLGGQWNYSWRTGFDEYSEPVHSSMYQNLWTNLPKECSEFADYSFEEHFGQPLTSFPPRTIIYDYIQGYARRNNIRKYIQFNTVVRWISYSDEKQKFIVIVKDLCKDKTQSEEFNYVIIASGHYSTPHAPYFNGIETFPGRVIHSHDFRSAQEFVGQDVLIIGNGVSAEDIALQLYKYGATSATMSYRTKPKYFKWPAQIKEVPLLVRVDKHNVIFKDDSISRFDSIIFCTGYVYHFPFLDDNLRLKSSNSMYHPGLYKNIVWVDQPRLMYLGMQRLTFSFNIGNVQAWYARDIILKRIALSASKDEMMNDIKDWQMKAKNVRDFPTYIQFYRDYVENMIETTDYMRFNLDQMVRLVLEYFESRNDNLLTYREKTYTSTITNTLAKEHHTSWLREMNDRLENFIKK